MDEWEREWILLIFLLISLPATQNPPNLWVPHGLSLNFSLRAITVCGEEADQLNVIKSRATVELGEMLVEYFGNNSRKMSTLSF